MSSPSGVQWRESTRLRLRAHRALPADEAGALSRSPFWADIDHGVREPVEAEWWGPWDEGVHT
jgi:hypothetical protein